MFSMIVYIKIQTTKDHYNRETLIGNSNRRYGIELISAPLWTKWRLKRDCFLRKRSTVRNKSKYPLESIYYSGSILIYMSTDVWINHC